MHPNPIKFDLTSMECHESMSGKHCRGAAYAETNPMIVHELETIKRNHIRLFEPSACH